MTCIAGYVAPDGDVYVGADSQATSGWVGRELAYPAAKVFRRGPFVIAVSGSHRVSQLVRYRFDAPPHPEGVTSLEYMATLFVDTYRGLLREHGALHVANGIEHATDDDGGSSLIVGYRGELFTVWADLQVSQSPEPYTANGSGWEFALGAFHTLTGLPVPPRKRLKMALEASAAFAKGVGGPIVIECLEVERIPKEALPVEPEFVGAA